MQATIRRSTSQRAAEWEARIATESNLSRRDEWIAQATTVAASIRWQLDSLGVEPDESTAAFLARYGG
ncbi:MAG: hypothetical protein ABR499_05340 [Gemmatimonadaceae bacterium]